MDKNTLSQYGWVIICIMVLAIMIGLATPFGNFVKESVLNATDSFGQKVVGSLDAAGVDIDADSSGTGNITTETSDNVMMEFMIFETGSASDKTFFMWAADVTRIEFAQSYEGLTIVDNTSAVTANSGNAIDLSAAGDGSVVAYLTTEGEDKVLTIAGEDGVVMANENSAAIFAMLPKVKAINFNNSFNTSNAVNMNSLFYGGDDANRVLTSLDLSSFDTSNVTDMSNMFRANYALTSIDLSSFDTSNVVSMEYMFSNCNSLTALDVSNFNTSKVTTMSNMFNGCYVLESLELSSFDTSNVTDMNRMFSSCEAMKIIDVSSFNTSNVAKMNEMFGDNPDLEHVYVGDGWDTSLAESQGNAGSLFYRSGISAVEKI